MDDGEVIGSKFRRVCVFCGSNSGHRQVFGDAALELGDELVCFLTWVFLYVFFARILAW